MFHVISARAFAVTTVAAGALTLAAACGGGSDSTTKAAPTIPYKTEGSATAAPTGNGGGSPAPSGKSVEIHLTDNVFDPKTLTIPVGTEVEIDAKNTGQAIHNMHILSQAAEGKDFISDAMVNPGKESKFKVKFSKKGTYDFQCDYHVPDMVGKITVS